MMKGNINEIGDTENGMYAIGQVASRAYDRMLNSPRNKKTDGVVALDPKYGKVAQDATHAAVGGYMDWRKKFKEQNRREPSDDEYRAWMQNYRNGFNDYGKPESERKGIVKVNETQLCKMIAESVKNVLSERYLEPGTADYKTDKIAKELKRFYPQYEDFVDEYVYGGYYERFANRVNPDIQGGFREFIKSKQGKPKNNQPDRETIDKVAELIDFLDNNKRGYHVEENHSIEELHDILINWFYTYSQQGEMNSAIGG